MSVPVRRNGQIEFVITTVARKKRAFEKYQYMLIKIRAHSLDAAMENARHYESTKK